MTEKRRDGTYQDTDWTRGIQALSSQHFCATDADLIWHSFKTNPQNLMLIEQKTNGAKPGFAQMDTLHVVDQMLRQSSGRVYRTARGLLRVNYRGLHVLTFSGTTLNNSQHIYWNGLEIARSELIRIMRYEIEAP